jgi:hypothetical protein
MNMLRSWLTVASGLQARAVFLALRAMALTYHELPGRKTVVVFSEGFLHSHDSEAAMQAVIDAANRANVAIYVIDASGGRTGMSPDGRVIDMDGTLATQDLGILGPGHQAMGRSQFDWAQTLGSDLQGDLGVVAGATGGFLVRNTNDLLPALDRVVDDASEFYTLVYYPANRKYDGAFRRIKVELDGQSYHLRFRQGYWALPPGSELMMTPAASELLAGVESGERKASFTPQLNAALVPAPDGRFGVSAAVSMPGKLVKFDKLKDEYAAGASVVLTARDAHGQLLAVHERYADVRLKREERQKFSSNIFNLQTHLAITELQPVTVQAIVRLSDGSIGVSASKKIDPAPASLNLRVTDLVLSDQSNDVDCTADPMDPLCVKGMRIDVPAQPAFTSSTRMIVYFGVLGLDLDAAQRPGLRISFRLGRGEVWQPLKPDELQATPATIPHAFLMLAAFNLKSLPPGQYSLEMTAEDKIQGASATERADFSIE